MGNEFRDYRRRRQHKIESRDKTRVIHLSNKQLIVTILREIARWKHNIGKGTLLKWSDAGLNRIIKWLLDNTCRKMPRKIYNASLPSIYINSLSFLWEEQALLWMHGMSDAKERFLKVYANIPLNVREEIILVLDDKPITWNVAYVEVKNDTKNAKRILDALVEMELI